MLINNYFFLAMDTQQELDRTLQRQDFGRDTLLSDSLAAYIQAARMYARIENAIAVLSDLQANRSYIYYGGVGDVLGVSPSGTSHETDSIWEKEVFDRIQPDDLVRKHAQELRFFHFVKKQPLGMRGRYYLEMYVRMHTAVRGYVPVCHRMYYVISPQTGNVVFALCLYTLCAALLPDVLVDSLTGSRTGIDCQSCGNLLSKRERGFVVDSSGKDEQRDSRQIVYQHPYSEPSPAEYFRKVACRQFHPCTGCGERVAFVVSVWRYIPFVG